MSASEAEIEMLDRAGKDLATGNLADFARRFIAAHGRGAEARSLASDIVDAEFDAWDERGRAQVARLRPKFGAVPKPGAPLPLSADLDDLLG